MLCVTVTEAGQVVQAVVQVPNPAECYAVLLSGAEVAAMVAPDFAAMGITPAEVAAVAAWGFGAIATGWASGLVAGWAAEAIRKA